MSKVEPSSHPYLNAKLTQWLDQIPGNLRIQLLSSVPSDLKSAIHKPTFQLLQVEASVIKSIRSMCTLLEKLKPIHIAIIVLKIVMMMIIHSRWEHLRHTHYEIPSRKRETARRFEYSKWNPGTCWQISCGFCWLRWLLRHLPFLRSSIANQMSSFHQILELISVNILVQIFICLLYHKNCEMKNVYYYYYSTRKSAKIY